MSGKISKVLLSLLIGVTNILYAAPCYGPNMPDKGKWDIGAEVHILLNRDMEKEHGEFKSRQFFTVLSYGIFDWLSFDGKIGLGDIKHKPDDKDEINYNTSFAGAYGFRVRVYQDELAKIRAIVGFQHISVHPEDKNANGVKNECIMDDWQLSFLVSKDFKYLSPYLGFKVSRCDLIHKEDGRRGRKNSDDFVGAFLGGDIYLNDRLRFNIEGRFIDEAALSAALVHKF